MFQFKMISLSSLALLGFGSLAIAGSSHPDAATVRAAFENHAAKRAAQPAAAATPSALVTFSMLGSATSTLDDTAGLPRCHLQRLRR